MTDPTKYPINEDIIAELKQMVGGSDDVLRSILGTFMDTSGGIIDEIEDGIESENFEEILSDYDLVFDLLGGEVLNRSFKVVKNGGRIISIKGEDPDGLAKKYGVHFELLWQWQDSEMLIELARQVDSRKLKPVIDRVFTLDQAAEAYEYIQSGRARGKVVIQVRKDL